MGVNGAGRKNTTDADLNLHPLFVRSMGSLFQPSGLAACLCQAHPCAGGSCLPSGRRCGVLLTTHGFGLPAWRGRFPLGVPFDRAKGTKTRLGRSPLRTSLGVRDCPCAKPKFGPSPLLWLLLLPPHQATLGSWPYHQAISTAGPALVQRRSRRRGFCCTILLRCGKGRGLPGPLVPLYCPGGFGRGKPLPYTQQRKKFGNVQGLFAPGPRQLGTVAGQGKALGVEAGTNRGADITHRMQRHLCDPTRLRAEPRTMHLPPSTAGWIPQGGGRPRLWWVFGDFLPSQKVTPAERPRLGRWSAPDKSEKDTPSVRRRADNSPNSVESGPEYHPWRRGNTGPV